MNRFVIRLAAPVQTWAGYQVAHTDVATNPIPTKSGVAGLLGACAGESDYLTLLGVFNLRVRVDRTNAAALDLQVAVPPRLGQDTANWRHTSLVHAATTALRNGRMPTPRPARDKEINMTKGDNRVQYSPNRSFTPHAEFVCEVTVSDSSLGGRLREGFARPVFMPYLGRRPNAPTFPFFLGTWTEDGDVLAHLPYVARHDDRDEDGHALRVHTVTGGYVDHRSTLGSVTPPRVTARNDQLTWAKEHLSR